jgi:hypothetical protein
MFNLEGVQHFLETRLSSSTEEQRAFLEQQAACLARSQRMTNDVASLRQKLASTEADQNRLSTVSNSKRPKLWKQPSSS